MPADLRDSQPAETPSLLVQVLESSADLNDFPTDHNNISEVEFTAWFFNF